MSRTIKTLLVGALLLALTAGIAAAQSAQATQDCGEPPGTEQRDRCTGSRGVDIIVESGFLFGNGEGVDDSIYAKASGDLVSASQFDDDRDKLRGEGGNDLLDAADGDDNDVLDGGRGDDECFGDPDDRYISCEEVDDSGEGGGL